MKFKIKQIKQIKPLKLYHVIFDKQTDMTLSLLRLQEFCESPKFKGLYFCLDDYIQWFSEKYKGPFDYHLDVGAHNIPGHTFDDFCDMHESYQDSTFTAKEEEVIHEIQDCVSEVGEDEPYYIIATCKSLPDHKGYFDHEFRHGLFYLLPGYKRDILSVLKKYENNPSVKKFYRLLAKDYAKNVLKDEVQAYALTGYSPYYCKKIKDLPKSLQNLRKDLKQVERKFLKNGKLV